MVFRKDISKVCTFVKKKSADQTSTPFLIAFLLLPVIETFPLVYSHSIHDEHYGKKLHRKVRDQLNINSTTNAIKFRSKLQTGYKYQLINTTTNLESNRKGSIIGLEIFIHAERVVPENSNCQNELSCSNLIKFLSNFLSIGFKVSVIHGIGNNCSNKPLYDEQTFLSILFPESIQK